MGASNVVVGTEIPSCSKVVTQEKIALFEASGIGHRENIHTSPEVAAQTLGTTYPIASGRMSLAYMAEALRRFFGPDVFNHTGTLSVKNIRPVKAGDTITVHGKVTEIRGHENGTAVAVEIWCENQHGDKTTVGTGTAVI
jgi:acyl dehydratase